MRVILSFFTWRLIPIDDVIQDSLMGCRTKKLVIPSEFLFFSLIIV